jgi:DNA-directed RNA polymerase specialized sigma24 family protein
MKAKSSRFNSLVARYYPAVYGFASRLTDDPREAVLLTHDAFNSTRKQLQSRRDEVALVTILLNAVSGRVLPPLESSSPFSRIER